MRINARLDEEWAAKLAFLREKTGARTTEIIRRSLELYYREVSRPDPGAKKGLDKAGFIGCGSAEPDLSQTYKDHLAVGLGDKA